MKHHTIPPDYHTHTELCQHAGGRPLDYAKSAESIGLHELACTDHGPTPDQYDPTHRMNPAAFVQYRAWVEEAQAQSTCRVLYGIEADFYESCTHYLAPWLEEQPFDLVLGSIHYLDYWNLFDPAQQSLWNSSDLDSVWKKYFELLLQLVETRLYNITAHFDLPKRAGRRIPDDRQKEFILPVLDAIAKTGMAIEINTSGLQHHCKEMYPSPLILSWAHEREIPIVFGSDAHNPARVAGDFEKAVALATSVGYTQRAQFRQRMLELVQL